ncbi:histidine kinase [Spongiivirga sp. MCCC 1A20706]|uniref:sensor histidine kinase n=1 Tax=Spongiivirga sp. MCCC 1A20706 TaxID=3160963 RepID=UPI0039776EB8
MLSFLKRYKAFWIGAIVVAVVTSYLSYVGAIKIPEDAPLELVLIMGFWWLAVSFTIRHIQYLKRRKEIILGIALLIITLFAIFGANSYFQIPDHPIVMFLLVIFWLGLFYLIFPKFFMKYRILILVTYGIILTYFFYLRADENYLDQYHDRALNLLMLPIPILFFIWIYEQWKWFRNLKSEKSKAELELLKTQVNPHFLFNTLNNLYALSVKRSDQAPEVILKLSDMMRYTIYEGKNDRVLLSDEIAYLENYIALHEIRHYKNVSIQFEHHCIDDDKVAPLLFIILLENAFKHGVEKLANDAFIKIKLTSDLNEINFLIENNYEQDSESEDKGIGLENLKKRLLLIYPNTHSLNISQVADIYKVNLRIKKR